MKKNLIALAVLAAAGAASAQSSVTLYGRVDAGLVSAKAVDAAGVSLTQTKLDSNVLNNSLWGFKGTEDLGNGLKANFVLESGMSMDTGAQADTTKLFNRKATVGLSGNFGSVELGRNYTAYDTLRSATNNTGDTNMAVTGDVWKVGGDYNLRTDNSVRFDSANYSGFSGSVAYAFGENKNAADNLNNGATDTVSLHVKYANGPLLVGYAHQTEEQKRSVTVPSSTKYNLIAGSYDFGVVKLNAGYNKVSGSAARGDDTEYQVGVSAPFGATTVYFGYANGKNEIGAVETKRAGFDLAATYALSKRTTAYAGYKTYETKNTKIENTVYGVGVRHVF
ncbi:porin [Malikia granosa]|nr:porin [Malikia granosa]